MRKLTPSRNCRYFEIVNKTKTYGCAHISATEGFIWATGSVGVPPVFYCIFHLLLFMRTMFCFEFRSDSGVWRDGHGTTKAAAA